jgi:molybdopterin-guanine dinucleotide biosynthesis protein A
VRILDRAIVALRAVTPEVILISSDPQVIAASALPARPDTLTGLGALGGIHAALLWAREKSYTGVLAVACDMPFLSPALLGQLLTRAAESDAPAAVLPESGGRRGVEPLCAWYGTDCIPAIESAARRGDSRMIAFHDDVRVARLPLDVVTACGDPEVMFLNVNTPEDRALAERVVSGVAHD